jgi:hypothetical protein
MVGLLIGVNQVFCPGRGCTQNPGHHEGEPENATNAHYYALLKISEY